MVPAEKILASFLSDAVRLSSQAQECVNQLTEQAGQNRVSPAQIHSLQRIVHTLKGTAGMIEGCEGVVKALTGLEDRLAQQSVVDAARRYEWIALARESVQEAHDRLVRLQNRERYQAPGPAPLVQGLTVRARVGGQLRLLWFPLSCLTQVFQPAEMESADGALKLDGRWVPLVGEGPLGLGVRAAAGQAILRFEEAIGIAPWSSASRQGAQSGLDVLASSPRMTAA